MGCSDPHLSHSSASHLSASAGKRHSFFFFCFILLLCASLNALPLRQQRSGCADASLTLTLPSHPPRAAGLLLHAHSSHMKASDEAEILLTALVGSGRSAVLILLLCFLFPQ